MKYKENPNLFLLTCTKSIQIPYARAEQSWIVNWLVLRPQLWLQSPATSQLKSNSPFPTVHISVPWPCCACIWGAFLFGLLYNLSLSATHQFHPAIFSDKAIFLAGGNDLRKEVRNTDETEAMTASQSASASKIQGDITPPYRRKNNGTPSVALLWDTSRFSKFGRPKAKQSFCLDWMPMIFISISPGQIASFERKDLPSQEMLRQSWQQMHLLTQLHCHQEIPGCPQCAQTNDIQWQWLHVITCDGCPQT